MTLPWDQTNQPTYDTIALAVAAITAAGYVRNTQRHIWVNGNRTAKVQRTKPDDKNNCKFVVQFS